MPNPWDVTDHLLLLNAFCEDFNKIIFSILVPKLPPHTLISLVKGISLEELYLSVTFCPGPSRVRGEIVYFCWAATSKCFETRSEPPIFYKTVKHTREAQTTIAYQNYVLRHKRDPHAVRLRHPVYVRHS